ALNVVQRYRDVHHVMARLRIGKFDPVDQHQGLIKTPSADADIGLGTADTSLAHVDARDEGQHFLQASGGGGFNGGSLDDLDISGNLVERDFHPVFFDGNFL